MHTDYHPILLALCLCACSEPFQGGSGIDVLPDLLSDLEPEGCDDVDGVSIEGASSYFYGELVRSDSVWTGSESWLLFSNPSWQAQGQGDCQIEWHLVADEVGTQGCDTCDLGLSVSASIDPADTSCPESLYSGLETFTVGYELERRADGSASWHFADSGEMLGEGHHADDALNYITSHQCVWF